MDREEYLKTLYKNFRKSVKNWRKYGQTRDAFFDFLENNFADDFELMISYYSVKEELEDHFDRRSENFKNFKKVLDKRINWHCFVDGREVVRNLREIEI